MEAGCSRPVSFLIVCWGIGGQNCLHFPCFPYFLLPVSTPSLVVTTSWCFFHCKMLHVVAKCFPVFSPPRTLHCLHALTSHRVPQLPPPSSNGIVSWKILQAVSVLKCEEKGKIFRKYLTLTTIKVVHVLYLDFMQGNYTKFSLFIEISQISTSS